MARIHPLLIGGRRAGKTARMLVVATERVGQQFSAYMTQDAIPLTDTEELAYRLAKAHIKDGREDLAVEDLKWYARRVLEGRG